MAEEKKGGFLSFLFNKDEAGKKPADDEPKKGPIKVEKAVEPFLPKQSHPLPRNYIKLRGVFDMEGLYKLAVDWFVERKYEVNEKMYKAKPPELEIEWIAQRRKDSFVADFITVNVHGWGSWVDVQLEGEKKQRFEGRLMITFDMRVETNYEDIYGNRRWNTELERRMVDWLNRYILKKDLDVLHEDVLYYEVYKLHAVMKEFLDLQTKGSAY